MTEKDVNLFMEFARLYAAAHPGTGGQEGQEPAPAGPPRVPTMLTIRAAADKTGLSYDFIRKLCAQEKITFIKAGSKFLVNFEKLVEYLDQGEKVAYDDGE